MFATVIIIIHVEGQAYSEEMSLPYPEVLDIVDHFRNQTPCWQGPVFQESFYRRIQST